ncbi:MAG TPA: hypothetical protein VEA37_14755, partial [Flavobacterium sp.]|nr:hypothetical protein [Flavobacterium sp.]
MNVVFLLASTIDDKFVDEHPDLRINAQVKKVIANSATNSSDVVLMLVENIGETNAIEVKVDVDYKKRNLGSTSDLQRTMKFGTLKINQKSIELIEVFDQPAGEDYFKIKKCLTEYSTVNDKYSDDGSTKVDASDLVTSKNIDE